jgi:hypothetical protein
MTRYAEMIITIGMKRYLHVRCGFLLKLLACLVMDQTS